MLMCLDEFEYDRNKVTLGRELGSGAFGTVYEAIAHGIGDSEGRTKVSSCHQTLFQLLFHSPTLW
jgi:hypothetical protein